MSEQRQIWRHSDRGDAAAFSERQTLRVVMVPSMRLVGFCCDGWKILVPFGLNFEGSELGH